MSLSNSDQFCAICDRVSIWLSIEFIVLVHLRFISVLCLWIFSRLGWSAACSNFSASWFKVSICSCWACGTKASKKWTKFFLQKTKLRVCRKLSVFFGSLISLRPVKRVIEVFVGNPRERDFYRTVREEKNIKNKLKVLQKYFLLSATRPRQTHD